MSRSYTSSEVLQILSARGFKLKSIKGSHHKYIKETHTVIIPHPKKQLPPGTLASILRQAGLTKNDLLH